MTEITTYQCDVCYKIYPYKILAENCEKEGVKPPRHKVGDTVYIVARYPTDYKKPLARRTIIEVVTEGYHTAQYVLSDMVQTGKQFFTGCKPSPWNDDIGYATDDDLHALNDVIDSLIVNARLIITEALVDENL